MARGYSASIAGIFHKEKSGRFRIKAPLQLPAASPGKKGRKKNETFKKGTEVGRLFSAFMTSRGVAEFLPEGSSRLGSPVF